MPDCTTCAYAEWQRTKAGRLHPSGAGKCTWDGWRKWELPKAFYYITYGWMKVAPQPSGGCISRKDPRSDCPCYQPHV